MHLILLLLVTVLCCCWYQYHQNGMFTEAINTYTLIVKNKQYPQSGRLRVNMGNIYYEQKKYAAAIKMYRMALDQIPNTGREIRYKIMRNIGNAFVRLGQFQDAIASFEQIMDGSADFTIGSRFVEGGGGTHMPAYRRLGIRVITATSNLSNELGIRDTQSGFRAFSARALDRLRFDAEGMELSLEMLEDAQEKQLHVREVPTVIRYDVPKGSNYTAVSHGFTVLSWALISLSQKKPLLVLGLPGMGLFATGAAMGLNVAQNVTSTLDTFLGDGLTAIWVGVLGLSLMATGLVLQGVRSLLRHLIVEHFGID